MPIRPKHVLGASRPSGKAPAFVDREEPIAAFHRGVAAIRKKDYHVVAYYGIGGIGKSTLRRELARQADALPKPPLCVVLDFDIPSFREQETALFALRKALEEDHKVKFPSFDLAYAVYWKKTRPHIPISSHEFPLAEEGSLLAELLSAAGDIPVLGLAPFIASATLKGAGFLREWWIRRGQKELLNLPSLEPAQIMEMLPAFWAADLTDSLRKKSCQCVIFLDTYEALWEDRRKEATFSDRDAWVRELVSQLPGVLWVICGREKLRWEEVDPDWVEALDQHLLGNLSPEDTRILLRQAGLRAESLQEEIVRSSRGVPFYVDLALDAANEIRARHGREPLPEDFRGLQKDLQRRFLRYLERPEVETLKVLSVARFWDRKVFESLVIDFHTGYPLTALSELCRFSFIREDELPNTWMMHDLMRETLQQQLNVEERQAIHATLFRLYAGQLNELMPRTVSDRHAALLEEAHHHGRETIPPLELYRWFQPIERVFCDTSRWGPILPLLADLQALVEAAHGGNHPELASVLFDLGSLYMRLGRYAEAEAHLQRALAIREQIFGPEHPELIQPLGELVLVLRFLGRFRDAGPLCRRALDIAEKTNEAGSEKLAAAINLMALNLSDLEQFAEAEALYLSALSILERTPSPTRKVLLDVLHNLADLRWSCERYAEAEPLYRRILTMAEEELGPDHPDMSLFMSSLADNCHHLGQDEEAESLYSRALELRERNYGPRHPQVAMLLNEMGMFHWKRNRLDDAEPPLRRSLEIKEETLGTEHPEVAITLNNLARVFRDGGRYTQAEPYYHRSLNILEKTLGGEHSYVTHSLANLAAFHTDQGQHSDAAPYLERCLAIREKTLGDGHPDLVRIHELVAENTLALGDLGKALIHARRGMEMLERCHGPDHPGLTRFLLQLGMIYAGLGREVEAREDVARAKTAITHTAGLSSAEIAENQHRLDALVEKLRAIG